MKPQRPLLDGIGFRTEPGLSEGADQTSGGGEMRRVVVKLACVCDDGPSWTRISLEDTPDRVVDSRHAGLEPRGMPQLLKRSSCVTLPGGHLAPQEKQPGRLQAGMAHRLEALCRDLAVHAAQVEHQVKIGGIEAATRFQLLNRAQVVLGLDIAHGQPLAGRAVLWVELSAGGQTQQLGSDEWDKAIGDWQASRELWVRAHSEGDKADALREERKARRVLKQLAEWRPGYDSAWLDVEFLAAAERPSSIDVRKQFVAPRGWDIVIGNPPYQRSDKRDRERGDRLGYRARHNLYTMFIEAALEVAGEHGCVTLVVPHSIVFRRESSYRKLRQVIESAADGVEIRTYDNRPKPVFPKVPWIKGHRTSVESRQRVTILSVRKGTSAEENVFGCGLIRLDAENRGEILRADRRAVAQPRFRRQWTHAPTRETVDLLRRMWRESKVQPRKTATARTVAFPQTGMYFVTCLPSELSPLRNPKLHTLNDDEYFWPWIGLYNSHLFHAYWLMTGDAFHVTATEFAAIEPPAGWKDESLRSRIEETSRRLVSTSVLDACKVVHTGRGRSRWPNVNFHSAQAGRMVVTALDRLLLEAYGLGERPLLDQIRIMRTGSAHLIQ